MFQEWIRSCWARATKDSGDYESASPQIPLQEQYRSQLLSFLPESTWVLDEVTEDGKLLTIRGWLLLKKRDIESVTFTVNGQPFPAQQFGHTRPDIERLFWFSDAAQGSGFTCSISDYPFSDGGHLEIQLCDKETLIPLNEYHSFWWRRPSANEISLPDGARRSRVHGSTDEQSFRITGLSSFLKLQQVLKNFFGKTYSDFSNILDWGCGCGRVLRYFQEIHPVNLTGIDIDEDNIKWCQSAYLFAKFASVPLIPPTQLQAETFDLVIGLSVFTHLRHEPQLAWLAELKRITKPGAILLLTTLGANGITRSGVPEETFKQWKEAGFVEAGQNNDLSTVLDEENTNYYINTLHTAEYIKRVWGRYFNIIGIVEGAIGNHQDIVVLQK